MTPEQRVCQHVNAHPELRDADGYIHIRKIDELVALIESAVAEAVQQEREACATVLETWKLDQKYWGWNGKYWNQMLSEIGDAIRARGAGTT